MQAVARTETDPPQTYKARIEVKGKKGHNGGLPAVARTKTDPPQTYKARIEVKGKKGHDGG